MATLSLLTQRDLLTALKRETSSNVSILNKVHSMPNDLSMQIFKENALEKPTQSIFINLSYYLVQIIDPEKAATFTWPLYDSKSEKTYRSELSAFIAAYAKSGDLAPVMSSFFVNPGCFKVTKLIFQMSHLALQRVLKAKMQKEHQKTVYSTAIEKYKSGSQDLQCIEKETQLMTRKLEMYQQKKAVMVKASELLKNKICENEEKLASIAKQKFLPDLVDNFITEQSLENGAKTEVEKIKNVKEPVQLFENWLQHIDESLTNMENDWDHKITPFLETSKHCQEMSEALLLRHTGELERNKYMVEYDSKVDEIATKDLETQVNPNQRHILKNIVKDDRLNFPYLIRGFLISVCFILKNETGDDIHQINEYLEAQKRNFGEMVSALHVVLERVMDADSQLQRSPVNICNESISLTSEIPPLPDLSDLKATQTLNYEAVFDSFTPLKPSKHHFNLRRKASVPTFVKPPPRSLAFATPYQMSKDDILKGLNSSRVNFYEGPKLKMSQNISIISQGTNRGNETTAERSFGFTKQQIQRLLSTKKTSSSKKHNNSERPKMTIKKGGLFNESLVNTSTLFRSHSSPNLFENKEIRPGPKRYGRKLSIMQEDASLLEVSGIVALDSESNSRCGTPNRSANTSRLGLLTDATSLPSITISPVETVEQKFKHIFRKTEQKTMFEDMNSELVELGTKLKAQSAERVAPKSFESQIPVKINPVQCLHKFDPILKETEDLNHFVVPQAKETITRKSTESLTSTDEQSVTPKSNIPIRKTSSLEKIIIRFKKVRASVVPESKEDPESIFKTIQEEKENNFKAAGDDLQQAGVLLHRQVGERDPEPDQCVQNQASVYRTRPVFTEPAGSTWNPPGGSWEQSVLITANRVLLPDLLSPSCSVLTKKPTDTFGFDIEDDFDIEEPNRKPRESLGTMLGVDQHFLDQFDLID